jgi:hypothetical protein
MDRCRRETEQLAAWVGKQPVRLALIVRSCQSREARAVRGANEVDAAKSTGNRSITRPRLGAERALDEAGELDP